MVSSALADHSQLQSAREQVCDFSNVHKSKDVGVFKPIAFTENCRAKIDKHSFSFEKESLLLESCVATASVLVSTFGGGIQFCVLCSFWSGVSNCQAHKFLAFHYLSVSAQISKSKQQGKLEATAQSTNENCALAKAAA